MAFVNEYVSKENIDKFDLYGLKKKYEPYLKFEKDELSYYWVINIERDLV